MLILYQMTASHLHEAEFTPPQIPPHLLLEGQVVLRTAGPPGAPAGGSGLALEVGLSVTVLRLRGEGEQ